MNDINEEEQMKKYLFQCIMNTLGSYRQKTFKSMQRTEEKCEHEIQKYSGVARIVLDVVFQPVYLISVPDFELHCGFRWVVKLIAKYCGDATLIHLLTQRFLYIQLDNTDPDSINPTYEFVKDSGVTSLLSVVLSLVGKALRLFQDGNLHVDTPLIMIEWIFKAFHSYSIPTYKTINSFNHVKDSIAKILIELETTSHPQFEYFKQNISSIQASNKTAVSNSNSNNNNNNNNTSTNNNNTTSTCGSPSTKRRGLTSEISLDSNELFVFEY